MKECKMKVNLISSVVALGSLVVAGSVFAEGQTFNNNLHSKILVSPAQLYQVKGARTDLSVGFDSGSSEAKTDAVKATVDSNGSNFNAAGIYSMTDVGVKAGLDVKYGMQTVEPKGSDKFDTTSTQIAPVALYSWDMITVAAKYNFITETAEKTTSAGKDLDTTYAIFTPAVLVSQGAWEAGLVYTSPVNKVEADELPAQEAATVTVHGRYAVMPELKVGGSVAQVNWNAIEEDAAKDQTIVTANAEWSMNQLAIEGLVSYASEYYDVDAAASNMTIAQWNLEAAADYSVSSTATVGGALGYTMGSDKVAGTEYTNSDLAVSIRGNLMF